MHIVKQVALIAVLPAFVGGMALAAENSVPRPSIVPVPVKMELGQDVLLPTEAMRIVTPDASLAPLASILAHEMGAVIGIRPTVEMNGIAKPGDVELALTRGGKEEAYRLTVGETVKIEARTHQGMAYGTMTLLQAYCERPIAGRFRQYEWVLPHLSIEDEASKPFRGVLIDVARRYNSPRALKLVIQLARYYKIRYITLHLNDDQGWTFPLKSYPKAGSSNQGFRGPRPRLYTMGELRELVAFADQRGVTLIPGIEFPAHCNSIRRVHGEDFNGYEEGKPLGLADMANPRIYPAIQRIYGEVSELLASSPYIHIGCDEANISLNKRDTEHYKKFMADRNLENVHELFHYFAAQLAGYAKENGKAAIFWADGLKTWDHELPRKLPKDMIAMDWRSRYKNTVKVFLQSHMGEIHFLPTLPDAWPDGSVTGLRARGGFEVDITWEGGKTTGAIIRSRVKRSCTVRYGDNTVSLKTQRGGSHRLDRELREQSM